MNQLIRDVKIHIASLSSDIWYKLTLIDEEFKEYSNSIIGINMFIHLFYTMSIKDNNISWKIFEKLHSFNDKPAIIRANGTQEWYINGVLIR